MSTILSALNVNTDTSIAKIQALNQCQISIGTISACMFQRGLIALNVTKGHKRSSIKQALIPSMPKR